MILTETEIKKLIFSKGHVDSSTIQDAIQEACLAVVKAEREKPGDKQYAIGRAITAARHYGRAERIRNRIIDCVPITKETMDLLVAPEDEAFTEAQVAAFYDFLNSQDDRTRSVLTRYLSGDTIDLISRYTTISASQVSRIIRGFKQMAMKEIGSVE